MGRNVDYSDVTWRDFYDSKRNRPYVTRAENRMADFTAAGLFEYTGPRDHYRFLSDEYDAPGTHGARTLAFMYGDYRDKVFDDGGEPTAFEKPTADGWE